MPPDVVARLNTAIRNAAAMPLFRQRVESEGLIAAVNSPDELTRYVRSEEARWRKVVTEGKVSID
ncbi:Tripartite tricarboxylate transporter family receptor [compost metagenome]